MCFARQRRALFQHPNLQKWREHVVFCTFWLGNVLRATTACTFSTSEPPKVAQTCGVLYILTWKCASRHNGVHFFDIWASKSGPNLVCVLHFDFKMCFAPQRRAVFWHLNCQKWSGAGVFCVFWPGNVLRAVSLKISQPVGSWKGKMLKPINFDVEPVFDFVWDTFMKCHKHKLIYIVT